MSEHEQRPLPIAVALRYDGTGAPRVPESAFQNPVRILMAQVG